MLGVKETKEALSFVASLGNGIGVSLVNDGKVDLMDLPHFLPALTRLPLAAMGAQDIVAEILDLDDAEREELESFVINELDIPQDEVENYIERGLGIMLDIMAFVSLFYKDGEELSAEMAE